jgi:1-acyl-sn-glycerol-3-phosphate acyltransferase
MSTRAQLGRLLVPFRVVWWRMVWGLLVRLNCRRLRVLGVENLPPGPVVFAANHASHADTVVMQLVFAGVGRNRVLAAGAADYFFADPLRSIFATFVGVFPFPRQGEAGVERSRAALAAGWSVLLYPQGTRDGGPFRGGVARVARDTAVVVPVQITGTDRVLPKGSRLPKRSSITVRFGEPIRVAPGESDRSFAARLESTVHRVSPRSAA